MKKTNTTDQKKSLELKRRTIRGLTPDVLGQVAGGVSATCSFICMTGSKVYC